MPSANKFRNVQVKVLGTLQFKIILAGGWSTATRHNGIILFAKVLTFVSDIKVFTYHALKAENVSHEKLFDM